MTSSAPKLGKMNPKAQKFVPVATAQPQIYQPKPPATDKRSQKLLAFGQSTTDIKEYQNLLYHLQNLDSEEPIPMDLFRKMGKLKICKDMEAFNFTVNPLIKNRVVVVTVKNKKAAYQRKAEGHRERENRRSPTVADDSQMVIGDELSNNDRKKRSELREHAKKCLFKASQERNES